MSFVLSSELQTAFNKFDKSNKKFLTPEEYTNFIDHIVTSYKGGKEIKTMLDEKLKANNKITLQDLSESNKLIFSMQFEEKFITPSNTLIHLLKELKESNDFNESDKEKIDWGIDAIMSGKLYQTELGTTSSTLPSEERKTKMIPWLEVFSTPKFDPSLIDAQKDSSMHIQDTAPATTVGISPVGAELLKSIDSLDFNIFEYEKLVGRKEVLPSITYNILKRNNVLSYLDEKALANFTAKLRDGYKATNPYHNDIHASDVVQFCNYLLQNGLLEVGRLEGLDVLALIIAAVVHDFRHPGVNNNYLINTNNELALLYNDQSILENYHVSEAYKLIWQDKDCNIFANLTEAEQKILRKRITGLVLATDNAKHFENQSWLERMISGLEISKGKNAMKLINQATSMDGFECRQRLLMVCIHLADISNPARPFLISQEWAKRVSEEFYLQGDHEKLKGLPISMSCDRETGNLPKFQMGFITGLVRAYVEKIVEVFPKLQNMLDNASMVYQEWANLAEKATS